MAGAARPEATGIGGLLANPSFDWKPVPKGVGLAYDTAPLAPDTVMVGTGSVDLWLGSTARDVDLEVTISEVRPDGEETYVQSGWLRASRRALDESTSTPLAPVPTFAAADAAPLPRGKLSLVRVPLYPFGHAFRAGSRVRITVQPPGGNRPTWAFDALTYDHPVTNQVGVSGAHASKVVLPVLDGCDRAHAAPCMWQPAGPSLPTCRGAVTMPNPSPVFQLADHYVERFAALDPVSATGEGIGGHDHEMTDYSPSGSDERAELDRAYPPRARTDGDRERRRPGRRRSAP